MRSIGEGQKEIRDNEREDNLGKEKQWKQSRKKQKSNRKIQE